MNRREAFTLIELLAVISIIAILAALVVGTSHYAWLKAATSRAHTEIAAMENALENYKSDYGAYPTSTPSRSSGVGKPPGNIEFSNSGSLYTALAGGTKVYYNFPAGEIRTNNGVPYIYDPFGNPYNYFCSPGSPDQTNQATFDLWSYGPGGTDGAPDEITNWKQQ